jgi:hypothetical protein
LVTTESNTKKSRAAQRDALVRKAYRVISKQLEADPPNKAIDDLVKLLKADKDLGTDEVGTGEIGLRWEKSKHEE